MTSLVSMATGVTLFTALGGATAASAAVPTPAENSDIVQQVPAPVFLEDFENGSSSVVDLRNYVGSTGMTYTADHNWLNNQVAGPGPSWAPWTGNCNGLVLGGDFTLSAEQCGEAYTTDGMTYRTFGGAAQHLWATATALGLWNDGANSGGADPNHALSAFTTSNPGEGIEIKTQNSIPTTAGNFYLTQVSTGAINCHAASPIYRFYVNQADGSQEQLGGDVTSCTAPGETINVGPDGAYEVRVSTSSAPTAFKSAGETIGFQINNVQGSGAGNDASVDNVRFVDATPHIAVFYTQEVQPVNAPTPLTIRAVNTTENSAKEGFSYTYTLPDGTRFADDPAVQSQCGGSYTISGNQITVTNASLVTGAANCDVTFNVTSSTPGTAVNDPSLITNNVSIKAPTQPTSTNYVMPTAVDDAATTEQGVPVSLAPLSNDSPATPDAPLIPSTLTLINPATGMEATTVVIPGQGTWTNNGDGTATFQPVPSFVGETTPVPYYSTDKYGNKAQANLTVTVTPAPNPPIAVDDATSTPQGVPVSLMTLANDTGNGLVKSSVKFVDGSGNLVDTITVPGEGTWTVDPATGNTTFTPTADFTGVTSPVTYQVTDANGLTAQAKQTVTVVPKAPNQPLAAVNDSASTPQGTPVTLDTLKNDVGVGLDPASVKFVTADGSLVDTITVPGEGTWTVDPATGKTTFTPVADFTGVTSPVTYQVKDAAGQSAQAQQRVTVVPKAPNQPLAAVNDSASTDQGVPVDLDTLANDVGVGLDPASVKFVTADGSLVDTVTVPGEGTWTVDPTTGITTFTPVADFYGVTTPVTYQVKDAAGQTATAQQRVTVIPDTPPGEDAPPAAVNDAASTPQGTPVVLDTLTNDVGVGLDPASVKFVTADGSLVDTVTVPGEGTWTVDPVSGDTTFTPEAAFTGVTTPVTYQVTDANGKTAQAQQTVTVVPSALPAPPAAVNDSALTPQGTPVVLDTLKNDVGVGLDPASVKFVTADGSLVDTVTVPGEGTWTVNPATGNTTFTPVADFTGVTTPVTYQVTDGSGRTAQAQQTVTVVPDTPPGETAPPAAVDDAASTPQGTPVSLNTLDNDLGDGLDPASVTFIDGSGNPVSTITVPGEGVWTVDPATGDTTFTPEPDFLGVTTPVTYQVTDANGQTAQANQTVTVYPSDGELPPPAAVNDAASTDQGTPVTLDTLANDVGEGLDPASVKFVTADGSLVDTITVPGEGTWTVNPATGNTTFTPVADFTGITTPVTYQVTDANGQTAQAQQAVTVIPVPGETPPPAAVDDSASTQQGEPVVLDTLANDVGEGLDPASVTFIDPSGNPADTIVVPGEGTWTVDPATGNTTFTPEPDFTGITTPVTYQVTDANGKTAQAQQTVTVVPDSGETALPAAVDDSASTDQGTPVTLDTLANDIGEGLDPASVTFIDGSGNAVNTITVDGEGTWAIDPTTGNTTFTPVADFTGVTTPVTYRVTDANGNTTQAQQTVTVVPDGVTAPPLAVDDAASTPQGTAVTLPTLDNDFGDGLDPASVTFIDAAGNPVNTITVDGEGTWTIDPATGDTTFTPVADFVGVTTPVTYQVADSSGRTTQAQQTVTVVEAGQTAPPAAVDDSALTQQGVPVTLPTLANDSGVGLDPASVTFIDGDGNAVNTITVPGEGVWTIDPVTGNTTFTPEADFTGVTSPVTYRVTDAAGQTDTAQQRVTVAAPNQETPPVAVNDSAVTPQGTPVTLPTLANDSGDGLDPASVTFINAAGNPVATITVPGQGVWSINPTTGDTTFTPEAGFTGTTTPVTYQVTDANGNTARAQQVVVVQAAAAPLAVNDTATTDQGTPVTLPTLDNDLGVGLDPASVKFVSPGGALVDTFTVPGQGTWTVDPATGDTTFTPVAAFTGTTTPVTYQVTDQFGNTTRAQQTVVVTPDDTTPPGDVVPDANPDTGTTPQNTPITLPILDNDTPGSPDVPLDPTTVDLIDPVTGQHTDEVMVPGEGTWTVNPTTGDVTFTPDPDFTGNATPIQYVVEDVNGTPTTSVISVNVTAVTPVANPDEGTTDQNTPVTVPVLDNDTPGSPDVPLDPTTVDLIDPVTGEHTDEVTVPGEGTWTVDPDTGEVTFTPEPDFTGETTPIQYVVEDENGTPTTSVVTVTVDPVTPVANPDTGTTDPDTPVTIPVLDNDTPGSPDVPLDPTTVDLIDPVTGEHTDTVTVPGEGTWTVTPGGDVIFTPAPGFEGTTTPVQYVVEDENGTPTTSTVTVTVTPDDGGTNDGPPVAVPDTGTTPQGVPITVPVLTNDAAGELPLDPTSVVFPETGQPAGATVSNGGKTLTVPGEGTYTVNADGTVTFTPEKDFTGTATPITYQVSDEAGVPATATVTITVTPVTPTSNPDTGTTTPDTPVTIPVLDNDNPGDPGVPLDPGTVQIKDPETGEWTDTVTVPGEGTWTVTPGGDVIFTPEPGFTGTTTPIDYTVNDTNGTPTGSTITVTVGDDGGTTNPPGGTNDGDGDDGGTTNPPGGTNNGGGTTPGGANGGGSGTGTPTGSGTNGGGLAYTGTDVVPMAVGALALLALGGAGVAASAIARRKRQA